VHKKNPDGTLKELHPPSGGPWGGTFVDENYIKWLTEMFGEATMKQFKDDSMDDFIDMLREFEMQKKHIFSDKQDVVVFKIYLSLLECHEKSGDETIATKIVRMNLSEDVKIKKKCKLHVSANIVRSWFHGPIDNTVRHITSILSEEATKEVSTILLVGGFGECELAQETIRKAVSPRTVVIPADASLAVLKGAVLFGHQPRLITSRRMKYTYGFSAAVSFDASKHPPEKMAVDSYGDIKVDHGFVKVVSKGTTVDLYKEIKIENVVLDKRLNNELNIFASTEQDPVFTTDPSCMYIGKLELGPAPGETEAENKVDICFTFGDTELKARVVILQTGKVLEDVIDCRLV